MLGEESFLTSFRQLPFEQGVQLAKIQLAELPLDDVAALVDHEGRRREADVAEPLGDLTPEGRALL
jgi:hypothetical protein